MKGLNKCNLKNILTSIVFWQGNTYWGTGFPDSKYYSYIISEVPKTECFLDYYGDFRNIPGDTLLKILLKLKNENLDSSIDFWFGIQNEISDTNEQYGFFDFDFDSEEEKENFDVFKVLKTHNIQGHIYKTGHGYHIITDNPMKFDTIIRLSEKMGCCSGHRDIAKQNKNFTLRIGCKSRRNPDIKYIGHTSGKVAEKNIIVKAHDFLLSQVSYLYRNIDKQEKPTKLEELFNDIENRRIETQMIIAQFSMNHINPFMEDGPF